MSKHIVMIEDEKHIADNYRDSLTQKGYKVSIYHDKPSAMAALSGELPDLVLVDIGLGDDEDAGFDICNQLRSRSETLPIVFLTARDTETTKFVAPGLVLMNIKQNRPPCTWSFFGYKPYFVE